MPSDIRVAIIDDDKLSTHNLDVKLRFIGENTVRLSSANWAVLFADAEKRQRIFTVLIGTLRQQSPAAIAQQVHRADPQMPLILTGDKPELETLSPETRSKVIACHKRPIPYQQLQESINSARSSRGLDKNELKSDIISDTGTALFRSLVGSSESITRVQKLIAQLKGRQTTVLVTGEAGVGKEIVARNLHYNSGRHGQPFIILNCSAYSHELLAMELFGAAAGFLGSNKVQSGCLEKANSGTLFLDAVDEMPVATQALLVKYFEEGSFRPMGSARSVQTDCRIIASASGEIEQKVEAKQFRQDLYYRLNVYPIEVPPLRMRREDIPDLLQQLIVRLEKQQHSAVRFNTSAIKSLQQHSWPGNVRELANLVERLSIIKPEAVVGVMDLPVSYQYGAGQSAEQETGKEKNNSTQEADRSSGNKSDRAASGKNADSSSIVMPLTDEKLQDYLDNFAREIISLALEDSADIPDIAADRLKITEDELNRRIAELGLEPA